MDTGSNERFKSYMNEHGGFNFDEAASDFGLEQRHIRELMNPLPILQSIEDEANAIVAEAGGFEVFCPDDFDDAIELDLNDKRFFAIYALSIIQEIRRCLASEEVGWMVWMCITLGLLSRDIKSADTVKLKSAILARGPLVRGGWKDENERNAAIAAMRRKYDELRAPPSKLTHTAACKRISDSKEFINRRTGEPYTREGIAKMFAKMNADNTEH